MHDKTIEERFQEVWKESMVSSNSAIGLEGKNILALIHELLATQNAEHQILMKEQYMDAKKMEQERVVKILEGMKPEFIEGLIKRDSDAWKYMTISEAITLITQ